MDKSMPFAKSETSLVSFSLVIPYDGINHAGGEYVRRHYRELSSLTRTTVIAPTDERNTRALATRAQDDLSCLLVDPPAWAMGLCARVGRRLQREIGHITAGLGLRGAVARDARARAAVAEADVVEFQYTEYLTLARDARRINPHAEFIGILHDVVSQRYERNRAAGGVVARQIGKLALPFVRRRERRLLRSVDRLIVFSDKDRGLLERLGVGRPIEVVLPSLEEQSMRAVPPSRGGNAAHPTVLFVGALYREENDEAARWLLRAIWPNVKRSNESARLVIAGDGASDQLKELASEARDVHVTGYVEDLGDWYGRANVVVAPLLRGAGVKFKVISAMLWGVPVVSTSIGAEGIGSNEAFFRVTDDASEFGLGISSALQNPEIARAVGSRSQAWARAQYGDASFAKRIREIYVPALMRHSN